MERIKVDIFLPVYNEETDLEKGVMKVKNFLKNAKPDFDYRIIVADNASKDKTLEIAKRLSKKYKDVGFIHLDQKGRGRALRKAWTESSADIACYMDIDISTDLNHLLPLIYSISKEGHDLSIGCRLDKKSKVKRSLKREILSRGYNFLLRRILKTKIIDAQCGFKAISTDAARKLIPQIKDNEWFFDTELLLLAERQGFKIKQIPVKWTDDPDSRVKIAKTVTNYLKNIWRMRRK